MFEAHRILIRLLVASSCAVYLAGCGQTGPLYLPVQKPLAKAVVTTDPQKDTTTKPTTGAE